MNKILIICGPTATGKTSVGIDLALKLKGEIVSADSRQAYQGLDIGTGKDIPSRSEFKLKKKLSGFEIGYYLLDQVPVWLLDLVSVRKQFNLAHWLKCSHWTIENIWQRGKLPIIVGGTGFYIRSLVRGIGTLGIPADKRLRRELEGLSLNNLQTRLKKLSPRAWGEMNQSDRANPRRLIRKIEILLSGKKITPGSGIKANWLLIGLRAEKKILYQGIDQRVIARLKAGLIDEIKNLLKKGIKWSDPGMETLAYKEFRDYFENSLSLEKAVEKWRFHEHGYARRQLTWFKKEKGINWFDIGTDNWKEKLEKLVFKWYSEKNGPEN